MVSSDTIDSDLFSKWTEEIERARKDLGIQGTSIAVVYKGKIIYAQGFGKRNDTDPFTPETLAPIASITKSFTAAAVGELVAKKKARWDAPVSGYLPEFQLKDPKLTSEVNFIDLLAHRTGFPSLDTEWFARPEPRIELIKQLRHVDPISPFRTDFIYSNIFYAVAGEAAARIAGTSYENLVLETVTRPLGMKESGFSNKTMATKPNYALPYTCKNFEDAQKGQTYRMTFDTSYMLDAPAGDLHSNVIELANYAKAIMHYGEIDGKQVLDKSSVRHLRSAYNFASRESFEPDFSLVAYGLGWKLDWYKGHQCIRHAGSNPGYISNIALFPADDLAIINLSNINVNKLAIYLPYYIADDVLNLPKTFEWLFKEAVNDTRMAYKYIGIDDPERHESHFPPQIVGKPVTRELSDFVGEYSHPVAGSITFMLSKRKTADGQDDKEDVLTFRYKRFEGIMDHYHYDSFRLRVIGDYFVMAYLVTFVTGDNGEVQECRVLQGKTSSVYTKVPQAAVEIVPVSKA